MIRIASFDIGRCNFAQYIEEFDPNILINLEKRYSSLSFKERQRSSDQILKETVLCGKRVSTGVYDFTDSDLPDGDRQDLSIRLYLLAHLSKFERLWRSCDIFVIEQQYFNTRDKSDANIDAIKMGEGVFMWFLDRYPFKTICYFGSQFKTRIFNAPRKLTKARRKKWAIEITRSFYKDRGDKEMINIFNLAEAVKRKQIKTKARAESFKNLYPCHSPDTTELSEKIINKQKLDDVSDAFLQCQAFKFKRMVTLS